MANKTGWEKEIRGWLASLNLPPTREAEVAEELAQHVEDRYHELLDEGLTEGHASRHALAEIRQNDELFDELRQIEKPVTKELAVLGVRAWNLTTGLWTDVRYAWRMLTKYGGVTWVAVVTIALGIGVNTAIFSTLKILVFEPFAFDNQERLLTIVEQQSEFGVVRRSVAPGNFIDWREQNLKFEYLAAFRTDSFDLSEGDQPERLIGHRVTPDFFDALGIKAAIGRTFIEAEYEPEKSRVVVIKQSLWQYHFDSDPAIVGRKIKINGQETMVIGVMPEDFDFPIGGGELWAPLLTTPQARTDRTSHEWQVIGLPRSGVTMESAQEDLEVISRRTQQDYPATNRGRGVLVISLLRDATRGNRVGAPFMFVSGLLVLLICCANVANLLVVRAASQQREIAIRLVLGASRFQMIRHFLADSILLALLGGGLGLLFAVWSVKTIQGVPKDFSKFIPGWERMAVDPAAVVFTLVVSVLTGLVCGLIAALAGTKISVNEGLNVGSRTESGRGSQRSRRLLVISQVACSVIVLAGAAVMIRSFMRLTRANLGIDSTNVLTMQVSLPDDKYDSPESRVNFYQTLLTRLAGAPDVAKVGTVGALPFGYTHQSRECATLGDAAVPGNRRRSIRWRVVTPDYFEAIGTPLRRGRSFAEHDQVGRPRVAVVNEAFAKQFTANREAIGQQIKCADGQSLEIIGLAADVLHEDLDGRTEPEIYVPYAQEATPSVYLVIRATSNQNGLLATVRREVASLDPSAQVFDAKLMDQLINERLSPKRMAAYSLAVAALIALSIAAIGVYALMSHFVSQQRHEIGLRLALGAQPVDVLNLTIRAGMKLVFIGCLIGVICAIALTRSLVGLMFGVSVNDPLMFAAVSFLAATVGLFACYLPARSALQVDPAVALKYH